MMSKSPPRLPRAVPRPTGVSPIALIDAWTGEMNARTKLEASNHRSNPGAVETHSVPAMPVLYPYANRAFI